jgi:RNA polymerase sigma-70 factor (ECF subfamily)
VVLAAGHSTAPGAQEALETLCRSYWYPLYVYVRRQGCDVHEAQDLTQEFFTRLLQKRDLETVRRENGRFRSFLLVSLKHFLINEWERARAAKRGGGRALIPLDELLAEERYAREPCDLLTPDKLFERRWALTLLAQAFARLREESASSGKAREFDHLKVFLSTPTGAGAYDAVAAELEMPVATVGVKVHRLRQRYGELIRAEIAHTVASPAEIEEEIGHLFNAVSR